MAVPHGRIKKADVAEHPKVFDHVGLLVNGPTSAGWVTLYLVIRRCAFNLPGRANKSQRIRRADKSITLCAAARGGFLPRAVDAGVRGKSVNFLGEEFLVEPQHKQRKKHHDRKAQRKNLKWLAHDVILLAR